MDRIDCLLLVVILGCLTIGCSQDRPPANGRNIREGLSGKSQLPKNAWDIMKIKSAEVHFTSFGMSLDRRKDWDKLKIPRVIHVEDQAEIERLLSFFPGVGRGLKSRQADPWGGVMKIRFTKADGTVLNVATNLNALIPWIPETKI